MDSPPRWKLNDEGNNYVNDDTRLQLLGIGVFGQDSLALIDNRQLQRQPFCLCDNEQQGLVVGPYCANEDCKWDDSADPGWGGVPRLWGGWGEWDWIRHILLHVFL